MKTIYKLLSMCLLSCGIVLAFTACSDDNTSDLQLNGECKVESIALDNFVGTVDASTRSIVVRLPEEYETGAMKVTDLKISDGASCNIQLGETLNMDAAKVLRVLNGDVYMDWTLYVLHDEARITHFVFNDIYAATIDQEAKTIKAYLPKTVDITNLVPTITYSQNATITPAIRCSPGFHESSGLYRKEQFG